MLNSHEWNELKAAAFETLLHNPGCDMQKWLMVLLREYTEEIVAALGSDPEEVIEELSSWWNNEQYIDENTGIAKTYGQWAKILSTGDATLRYRELVKEANRARGIE